MNINFDIISVLIFLPLISAILILPLKVKNNLFYYSYGCFFSIINFILSIVAMTSYDWRKGGFQFQSIFKIFAETDIKYFVGIDGLSITMIFLTALLTPICFVISYKTITNRVKEFVVAFLLIEALVIGAFSSLDLLFFYIFFEATLIPMFLVIGIWGGSTPVVSPDPSPEPSDVAVSPASASASTVSPEPASVSAVSPEPESVSTVSPEPEPASAAVESPAPVSSTRDEVPLSVPQPASTKRPEAQPASMTRISFIFIPLLPLWAAIPTGAATQTRNHEAWFTAGPTIALRRPIAEM